MSRVEVLQVILLLLAIIILVAGIVGNLIDRAIDRLLGDDEIETELRRANQDFEQRKRLHGENK